MWVCTVFISHCEDSSKWLGRGPRTKDEGLNMVCPKARGIWCASRALGLSKGRRDGLAAALGRRLSAGQKANVGRRGRGSAWQFSAACFCFLSGIGSMVISGGQGEKSVWGSFEDRGGCETDTRERRSLTLAGEMYTQGLPKVKFWLNSHSILDLRILGSIVVRRTAFCCFFLHITSVEQSLHLVDVWLVLLIGCYNNPPVPLSQNFVFLKNFLS